MICLLRGFATAVLLIGLCGCGGGAKNIDPKAENPNADTRLQPAGRSAPGAAAPGPAKPQGAVNTP